MQTDWEIKMRSHACSRTGRPFAAGEYFYTLLFREHGGFRREDVSEQAWAERNDNIQPFSFWRTKYEPPPPPPLDPLPKNQAETLLRRLIQENDPQYSNAAFILALMLERKKQLRPVESADPSLLVYEYAGTGETFVLKNPNLSLDRIPEIQREVSALLSKPAG